MSRPRINEPYNVPNLHEVDNQDSKTILVDEIDVTAATARDRAKKLLVQCNQLMGAVNSIRNGCQDPTIKKQLTRALLASGWAVCDDE